MTDTERRGYNDKNKDCPVRPHGAAERRVATGLRRWPIR